MNEKIHKIVEDFTTELVTEILAMVMTQIRSTDVKVEPEVKRTETQPTKKIGAKKKTSKSSSKKSDAEIRDAILKALDGWELSSEKMQEDTGLTKKQLTGPLRRLEKEGVVKRRGQARGTTYRLA